MRGGGILGILVGFLGPVRGGGSRNLGWILVLVWSVLRQSGGSAQEGVVVVGGSSLAMVRLRGHGVYLD